MLLVILVLVTVSGAAYWGVTLYQDAHPTAAPTTLMASPTPTVSPVERPFQTSFTAALPESVLQYALASSVENTDWLGRGAIEAYTEEFDDGAGGALVVSEGQWATSAQALDVLADLTVTSTSADAANHPQMGPVNVNGANAGRYILAINDDDTETITWTNGSAVLQLTGPPTEVTRAFSAFTI